MRVLTLGEYRALGPEQEPSLDEIEQGLEAARSLTAADLAEQAGLPFAPAPDHDPLAASGLELIQSSNLALDPDELALLAQHGFVISGSKSFGTFIHGYRTVYAEDLPVYVSADSILYALHRSYDAILMRVEWFTLGPALLRLLRSMHLALQTGAGADFSAEARQAVDLLLTVARRLVDSEDVAPVAGADPALIDTLVSDILAGSGAGTVPLFGSSREVDFSQFVPRGHYFWLPGYFMALTWLGRIDLRLVETRPDEGQVLNRPQLEAAFLLGELMDADALADWRIIHDTIGAFVGEPDSMIVPQLEQLLDELGLESGAELASLADEAIIRTIVDGRYGAQRISSHLLRRGLQGGTTPLASSFLLFGQRYVVDSHVLSNLVYDRLAGGTVRRMMPSVLDAAYAALGNDQAIALLADELDAYPYAQDLASVRLLVDAHPESYWKANLYNLWLGALRTLSPRPEHFGENSLLPRVAQTEAWGRRVLNTQLASWAELRHDTLLYVKQSYTGMPVCEYPDAYIDPYPALFAVLGDLAERAAQIMHALPVPDGVSGEIEDIGDYFDQFKSVVATLEAMAANQLTGAPHSEEHLAFVNQAVYLVDVPNCVPTYRPEGWYAGLFFDGIQALERDPTIADIHTQPTDQEGNPVGNVLHVGTGPARLMVVTVDGCTGPRAYAGPVSSFFEQQTSGFDRLDDERWAAQLDAAVPDDVPWLQDLVIR